MNIDPAAFGAAKAPSKDLNDVVSHVLGHGELCISTAESLACI